MAEQNNGLNRYHPQGVPGMPIPMPVPDPPGAGQYGRYAPVGRQDRRHGGNFDKAEFIERIRPYLGREDVRRIQRTIGNGVQFSDASVQDSLAMLEHLRSRGLDFQVVETSYRDQVEVKLEDSGIRVRVMDGTNPEYIGRVSDGRHYYNLSPRIGGTRAPKIHPTMEQKKWILNYVLGGRQQRDSRGNVLSGMKLHRNKSRNRGSGEYGYWFGADSAGRRPDDMVLSISTNPSPKLPFNAKDPASAKAFIDEAIRSANAKFWTELDINHLIRCVETGQEPDWSSKDNFADMQMDIYEDMHYIKEMYESGEQALMDNTLDPENGDVNALLHYYGDLPYLNPDEYPDWRSYSQALVIGFVSTNMGSYEEGFNPVIVSEYMDNGYSDFRNNEMLMQALKSAGATVDNVTGTDFYRNRLADQMVKFDESTAMDYRSMDDPFGKQCLVTVADTIYDTLGVRPNMEDIQMDGQGLIRWKAKRATQAMYAGRNGSPDGEDDELSGVLGQVFLPDEKGIITTKYAASPNYKAVPGYEARVVEGDGSMTERTRLRGYKDVVLSSIRKNLRADLMSEGPEFDHPTRLNNAYSHLYDRRFELDYFETTTLDEDTVNRIVATLAKRVKYPNAYADSGSKQELDEEERRLQSDGTFSYWDLTGHTNMQVMGPECRGYYDKWLTGSARNQGLVRYLTTDAQVAQDGRIIPGQDEFTDISHSPFFRNKEYNAWDRYLMAGMNLMTAKRTVPGVRTAMMTFGGWNFDDAYIVSKEFAERNQVRDKEGNMRPLMRGDKLSDFNGNKGVISLIVDRDMTPEQAAAERITPMYEVYKANPELELVGAPFSGLSRFNGGLVRGLMEDPQTFVDPLRHDKQGNVRQVAGGMGVQDIIVTDMTADEKTHLYEDAGTGRKFSGQLAWAAMSMGCKEIMKEVYGPNQKAYDQFREYLVSVGLDIGPTGELHDCYTPHEREERELFQIERVSQDGKDRMDRQATEQLFMDRIKHYGGMLELPFPLKFPTGEEIPKGDKPGTWLLPILSPSLRSDRQIIDGRLQTHDFSNHYAKLYMEAVDYLELAVNGKGTPDEMDKCVQSAQRSFDSVTSQIIDYKINGQNGKHSFIRDNIMGRKMPNSATLVATSDPRLEVDQIAISGKTMKSLGVKEDDYLLVWRDPILKDGGMRYLRVKQDDSLVGFAVNPMMDISYGLDFDGDSNGVIKLHSRKAIAEAMEKLTVGSKYTLLNHGVGREGAHPLYIQTGMDFASAEAANPKLKEYRERVEKAANAGEQHDYVAALNTYSQHCYNTAVCTDILQVDSMEHVVASYAKMVAEHAKGSDSKLKDLCKYLGVTYDGKAGSDNPFDRIHNVRDHGHTLSTDFERQQNQLANAVKVMYTGIAGSYSQLGMSKLANLDARVVLELTEKATQGVLDVKHDPAQAKTVAKALSMSLRSAYNGETGRGQNKRQMYVDEFKDTFTHIMENDLGVKINRDYVDKLAEYMRSPDGTVKGLKNMQGPPLFQVAYGGGFAKLKELAEGHKNLFEGEYTSLFAPEDVREGNPFQNMQMDDTKARQYGLGGMDFVKSVQDDAQYYAEQARMQAGSYVYAQGQGAAPDMTAGAQGPDAGYGGYDGYGA